MKRVSAALLVTIGVLPPVALAGLAFWLYATHMDTIGISVTATGEAAVAGLVLADLACLVLGTWLWRTAGRRAA